MARCDVIDRRWLLMCPAHVTARQKSDPCNSKKQKTTEKGYKHEADVLHAYIPAQVQVHEHYIHKRKVNTSSLEDITAYPKRL